MGPATTARSAAGRFTAGKRLRILLGLRLLAGEMARLPSIRALAGRAGAHRNTVAAVYGDLARFGLVHRVRGSGTYALPARGWIAGVPELREAACRDPGLARVLAGELGRPVRVDPGALRLFVPLDEVPPRGRPSIPVAPSGASMEAIRRLRPDDFVLLVSRSSVVSRLVRHSLLALHGGTLAVRRVTPPARRSPDLADPAVVAGRVPFVGADLRLADAESLKALGTDGSATGFVPLRLLTRPGSREADTGSANG